MFVCADRASETPKRQIKCKGGAQSKATLPPMYASLGAETVDTKETVQRVFFFINEKQ